MTDHPPHIEEVSHINVIDTSNSVRVLVSDIPSSDKGREITLSSTPLGTPLFQAEKTLLRRGYSGGWEVQTDFALSDQRNTEDHNFGYFSPLQVEEIESRLKKRCQDYLQVSSWDYDFFANPTPTGNQQIHINTKNHQHFTIGLGFESSTQAKKAKENAARFMGNTTKAARIHLSDHLPNEDIEIATSGDDADHIELETYARLYQDVIAVLHEVLGINAPTAEIVLGRSATVLAAEPSPPVVITPPESAIAHISNQFAQREFWGDKSMIFRRVYNFCINSSSTVTEAMVSANAHVDNMNKACTRKNNDVPPNQQFQFSSRHESFFLAGTSIGLMYNFPTSPETGRLYINPKLDEMPQVFADVAFELSKAGIVFQMKTPKDPQETKTRADRIVIYFVEGQAEQVLRAIETAIESHNADFLPIKPLFAASLSSSSGEPMVGVSFMQQPTKEGQSANQSRAKALMRYHQDLPYGKESDNALLRETLQTSGIDPGNPAFNYPPQGFRAVKNRVAGY